MDLAASITLNYRLPGAKFVQLSVNPAIISDARPATKDTLLHLHLYVQQCATLPVLPALPAIQTIVLHVSLATSYKLRQVYAYLIHPVQVTTESVLFAHSTTF